MRLINRPLLFLLPIMLLLSNACNQQKVFSDLSDYTHWISNPENGLVKTKYINGLAITMRLLPAAYLANREIEDKLSISEMEKDAILKSYQNTLTFLLTFAPDNRENERQGDVMYKGIRDYKEYKERVLTMNFDMASYVTLKTNLGELKPVLTNMENTYSLQDKRNINLVFVADENNPNLLADAAYFDIVYDDELFDLGVNHFVFEKEDIDKMPKLKI